MQLLVRQTLPLLNSLTDTAWQAVFGLGDFSALNALKSFQMISQAKHRLFNMRSSHSNSHRTDGPAERLQRQRRLLARKRPRPPEGRALHLHRVEETEGKGGAEV